ncbi:MAG: ABC transporter ATP-binding protein [Tepidisphaeraceae bacterium]
MTLADLPAIELQNVTRRFGRATVVDNVNMAIARGTTCGLIGLNGAGKTTAIRMLMGLLAPTSGLIRVDGRVMPDQRDDAKRSIGYVPDRPTIYPWMTGERAIAFCAAMYGKQWDHALVDGLTKSLRLDLSKPLKHLSKGSAAKLQLLLAVGHNPNVLVLDEPTSGFDVLARDEFLEGILTVNSTGTEGKPRTILFSSHALADVQRLVDTVAIIHQGKLLLHEPIDGLLRQTKRIRAVIDVAEPTTIAPPGTVRQSRVGREWTVTVKNFSADQVEFIRGKNRVTQLDVQDLTLDEVFRDYVRPGDEIVTAS